MLVELHIRDLGVISDAAVTFAPGLNVVTGETGVGKTLLMTSLSLLLGSRGAARMVRSGASDAAVEAVVAPSSALRDVLSTRGVDATDEVILARKLSTDGRSRAWVAGQLSPVSALTEIGDAFLEMHGQGASFALAHASTQLAAIDALARNGELLDDYRTALAEQRSLERERATLFENETSRARDIDILSFQVDEIGRAALAADEEESLPAQIARLEHAEKLGGIGAETTALVGAEGAAGALADAYKRLENAAAIDPSLDAIVSRLGELSAEATEIARDIRGWSESLEDDPAQLESLRERKALIASLKRKYGGTVAEIIAFAEDASAKLQSLAGADERIATIDADIETARTRTASLAAALTKSRRKAAKQLTELVGAELPALALPNAVFEASVTASEPTDSGADTITFGFSSAKGKPLEPIGRVASGGELSRAMIAVTLALASSHGVDVLVFDEADQGVGGQAALELGRRLQRLARSHQVLVVSHLPQIAAFADRHLAVRRDGDDVRVDVLEKADRLAEISRMLAGLEDSKSARAHAAELLKLADEGREAQSRALV